MGVLLQLYRIRAGLVLGECEMRGLRILGWLIIIAFILSLLLAPQFWKDL
jgi:hypothetical protein